MTTDWRKCYQLGADAADLLAEWQVSGDTPQLRRKIRKHLKEAQAAGIQIAGNALNDPLGSLSDTLNGPK